MATTYSGPSAHDMIQSHTLAKEIIARSNDAAPVLDASELSLLKRFIADPSSKDEMLKDLDMTDPAGSKAGAKAQGKESLVGYIIAQSVAGNEILSDEETSQLRAWFEQS